jgi:hypothetical protein
MADYNIFMAMVEKIGHDKRDNPIFKRDKSGNEILVPDPNNVWVLGDTAEGETTVSLERKTKLLDDQTSDVPEIFADWKRREGIDGRFIISGPEKYLPAGGTIGNTVYRASAGRCEMVYCFVGERFNRKYAFGSDSI